MIVVSKHFPAKVISIPKMSKMIYSYIVGTPNKIPPTRAWNKVCRVRRKSLQIANQAPITLFPKSPCAQNLAT